VTPTHTHTQKHRETGLASSTASGERPRRLQVTFLLCHWSVGAAHRSPDKVDKRRSMEEPVASLRCLERTQRLLSADRYKASPRTVSLAVS